MIAHRTSLAFLVVALLLAAPSFSAAPPGNTTNPSFSKAKKTLLHNVYADHLLTFYCGSSFDGKGMLTHAGGYRPKKEGKRAQRLEWEHIVPAQAFGQSFSEWRQGDPACVDRRGKPFKGRNCAEKVNLTYRYMQADMHNLVPAIGEVNGLRSNYSFAMIPGEKRRFGSCDMEIESKKAEPPPEVRGGHRPHLLLHGGGLSRSRHNRQQKQEDVRSLGQGRPGRRLGVRAHRKSGGTPGKRESLRGGRLPGGGIVRRDVKSRRC